MLVVGVGVHAHIPLSAEPTLKPKPVEPCTSPVNSIISMACSRCASVGSQNWRRLHKAGLYWIGLVFLVTLGPDVISMPSEPVYLAIGVLMAIAVSLRIAAFINGRGQRTAAIDSAR